MADFMQAGAIWQQGVRDAEMAHPVAYRRPSMGGWAPAPNASTGRTLYPTFDSQGALIETESRDFLFLASYLMFGTMQMFPESGDQISEVVNGVPRLFQVTMIVFRGKQACWRWHDNTNLTMRVHTKALNGG